MSNHSSNYHPKFARLLTKYLDEQDRSQAWLAKQLGVHHGSVSRWVAGNRPGKPEQVLRIADCLGIRHENRQEFFVASGYSISSNKATVGRAREISSTQTLPHQKPQDKSAELQKTSPIGDAEQLWLEKIDARLRPQIHKELFGIEGYVERLNQLLLENNNIWLIGIQGMGGLGKTTLVDYVIRQSKMGHRFKDIAWIDIKKHEFIPEVGVAHVENVAPDIEGMVESLCAQLEIREYQLLPPRQKQKALLKYLNDAPCLIILDNLESAIDKSKLVPFLHLLTKPSKVVITSRYDLPTEQNIARLTVKHLSKEHTIAFLRHCMQMNGVVALASTADEQLGAIHDLVGGNPLALRLVACQIGILSLSTVLQNLSSFPDDEIDEFYGYIFHESWRLLKPEAKQLLSLMPLIDTGSIEQLIAISEMNRSRLNMALRQLARMALVEVRGNLEEKRYFLYRLTETFLRKESLKWKHNDIAETQFVAGAERNLDYWLGWLKRNGGNVKNLDREWVGIV